jgi:hypothetical protein
VVKNFLEAFFIKYTEVLSLSNTLAILGVWKTLVISTALKALAVLATLITLKTWKGLYDFFLLFLVSKEILLPNRRPAPLYKGEEVKLKTLP